MRNFAHLERELFFCSSSPATSGFLPIETISRFFPQTQTGKLLSHTQSRFQIAEGVLDDAVL